MAAAAPPSDEECPVCHDDFTDPKILPCTHLVCRKCVLSWLHKGGNHAGCPLCRAAILPQGSRGQDVAVLVDDLPTDIITKAAVESRRVLNEKHVCVCDGTTKATSLCMECRITFCPGCVKAHKMIPATREHEIKQIAALTVDKLAASYQSSCAVHPGRQVEQFCSSHQELICLNCSTSTHRRCPDVEGIAGAAMVKRQRLKEQAKELEGKKDELQTQVCQLGIAAADGLAKFKAMKDKVHTTFDELRNILDKRCRDATAEIQKKEDEFLKDNKSQKSDLEKQRARCAALCSTVSRLASASDDPLLAMLVKLKSRLEDADLLCRQKDVVRQKVSAAGIGDFFFDPQSSARLKKKIAKYGQMRDPKQPQRPFMGNTQFGCASLQDVHGALPVNTLEEDSNMLLEEVSPSCVVHVTGLNPRIANESVQFFFSNKRRNHGGPVERVERSQDKTSALVYFIKPEDAENVAKKGDHSLDGSKLHVTLHKETDSETDHGSLDLWGVHPGEHLVTPPARYSPGLLLFRIATNPNPNPNPNPKSRGSNEPGGVTIRGSNELTPHPVAAGSVHELVEGMGVPRRHTYGYPQQGDSYREDPSKAWKRQTDGYRGQADSGLVDSFRSPKKDKNEFKDKESLERAPSNQYSSGRNHDSFDCRNLPPTAASSAKTSSETSGTRQKHDTVINLGDRNMRRITDNPVLLRELTTKVKSVGGRFRRKQPDQMIVTCLLDEPSREWEEAVRVKVNHFFALLPQHERLAAEKESPTPPNADSSTWWYRDNPES